VFQRQVDIAEFYETWDPARTLPYRYREYWVYEDGSVHPGRTRDWRGPAEGEVRTISFVGESGPEQVSGVWTQFSHGSGGVLLVQE
jgi:hypothetical protein